MSFNFQDLYCVRSDLGNLLKALGRLDEAKVGRAGQNQTVSLLPLLFPFLSVLSHSLSSTGLCWSLGGSNT
jgi:hypothetical protein